MSDAEVEKVIADFAAAAERAQRAGFDGIHLHSGNGYLLSQFNSPFANRRDDCWGGDPQRRARFILEVYRAVRHATGGGNPHAPASECQQAQIQEPNLPPKR